MDSVWYAKNVVRCIENHSKNFCIFATLLHKKSPGLFIPGLVVAGTGQESSIKITLDVVFGEQWLVKQILQ